METLNPPATSEELTQCANYILWGEDSAYKPPTSWTPLAKPVESLDSLLERPDFSEGFIHKLDPLKAPPVKRQVFDREKARQYVPSDHRQELETLFQDIDETDFQIESYELAKQKRTKPIRQSLLQNIEPAKQEELCAKSQNWDETEWLRQKKKLIELRRAQYDFKDNFCTQITLTPISYVGLETEDEPLEIGLKPFGNTSSLLVYYDPLNFNPNTYTESQLKWVQNYIQQLDSKFDVFFNLEDQSQLHEILLALPKLSESFQLVLQYYIKVANLTPIFREILLRKIKGESNTIIASYVNKTYGKTYSDNYISTIFCQKIIPRLSETVKLHRLSIEELPWPEHFKRCTGCGLWKLASPENFVHNRKSKDGFTCRCKQCDKKKRKGEK